MLNKDPNHRITIDQAMQHPWFSNLSVQEREKDRTQLEQLEGTTSHFLAFAPLTMILC